MPSVVRGKIGKHNNRQLANNLDRKWWVAKGIGFILDTRFRSPHFDGMMFRTQTLAAYPDAFKARMMRTNIARAPHVKPSAKSSRFFNQTVLWLWRGRQRRDG
jgi:hypothetical protein